MFLCYPQRIKQLKVYQNWHKRFAKVYREIDHARNIPERNKELSSLYKKRQKLWDELRSKKYEKEGIYIIPHRCNQMCPYYDDCQEEGKKLLKKWKNSVFLI